MTLGLIILSAMTMNADGATGEPCNTVSRKLNDGTTVSAVQINNPNGTTMFINPSVTVGTVSYPLAKAVGLNESSEASWSLCQFLSSGTYVKAEALQRAKNAGVWWVSEALRAAVPKDRHYRYQVHLGAVIEFDTIVKTSGENEEKELVGLLGSIDRRYEVLQSITCTN